MCGRYVMARATSDLVALGDAETNEELVLRQSWNVAPTAEVPILVAHADDVGATFQLSRSTRSSFVSASPRATRSLVARAIT